MPLLLEEPNVLGVFGHYLLIDENTHLLLVDLQAASARIAFDAMDNPSDIVSQGLLIPIRLELSPAESIQIEGNLPALEMYGFSLRSFGKNLWIIDAVPSYLDEAEVEQAVRKIAEGEIEGSLKKIIAQFAGVQKKRFLLQEALALFKELLRSKAQRQCPKGKPTMVQITHEEISRLFSKSI